MVPLNMRGKKAPRIITIIGIMRALLVLATKAVTRERTHLPSRHMALLKDIFFDWVASCHEVTCVLLRILVLYLQYQHVCIYIGIYVCKNKKHACLHVWNNKSKLWLMQGQSVYIYRYSLHHLSCLLSTLQRPLLPIKERGSKMYLKRTIRIFIRAKDRSRHGGLYTYFIPSRTYICKTYAGTKIVVGKHSLVSFIIVIKLIIIILVLTPSMNGALP